MIITKCKILDQRIFCIFVIVIHNLKILVTPFYICKIAKVVIFSIYCMLTLSK